MNLKDYLASNGISNEKLARGEKYALFDTAFFGNIFKAVKSVVSVKEAGQVVGQLLHSANRFVPSTPIFFATVNNRLEKITRRIPGGTLSRGEC
jgi:hypothetical protein